LRQTFPEDGLVRGISFQKVEHKLETIVDNDTTITMTFRPDDDKELVEPPFIGHDILDVGVTLRQPDQEQKGLVPDKVPTVAQNVHQLGDAHRAGKNDLLHLFWPFK